MFRPMVAGQRWIAAGLFDPAVREKAGMRWTAGDEVLLRLFGKLVEMAFVVVPDEIRLHPRALAAYRRAPGVSPMTRRWSRRPRSWRRRATAETCPCTTCRGARACWTAQDRWCTRRSRSQAYARRVAAAPPHRLLAMLEWSDVDIAVRDAVREFVDKEVRPHVDALESGEMEPYPIIRKLFATFGIDALARDSLDKRLARMRDGARSPMARRAACSAATAPMQAWDSWSSVSCAGCAWVW